jgi:hypothetical protein
LEPGNVAEKMCLSHLNHTAVLAAQGGAALTAVLESEAVTVRSTGSLFRTPRKRPHEHQTDTTNNPKVATILDCKKVTLVLN